MATPWSAFRTCTSTLASSRCSRGSISQVKSGEVVCIIGPSGSGKTTLLRCINFLERYDSGRIYVDDELVGYREQSGHLVPAREKDIARVRAETAMVFQQFNLFPHMTALNNVAFGPMKVRGIAKAGGGTQSAGAAGSRRLERQSRRPTRPSSPAVSNNAWPSPGPWRWNRR